MKKKIKVDFVSQNDISVDALKKRASSQGRKQMLNHLADEFKRHEFQDWVTQLRTKFDINPKDYLLTDNVSPFLPKKWKYFQNAEKQKELSAEKQKELSDAIETKAQELGLHRLDGSEIIQGYVFYNHIESPFWSTAHHLCIIEDLVEAKLHPLTTEIQNDDDRMYPVAIRLNPEATITTVRDFLDTHWQEIQEYLEVYKDNRLGFGGKKMRNDTIRQRDELVYELYQKRHSQKEIATQVNKKYPKNPVYMETVPKIVSAEKMARK